MGADHAGEFGDDLHPKGISILRRGIQDFRNLVQVPPQGKELLIGAGQSFELRLSNMGLPGQFGANHRDQPFRRQVTFVTGHLFQGCKLGGRQIEFYPGRGSFSPRADTDPRRSLCRLPIHALPNGIPQGMAQGDSVVLTPGLPGSFKLTQVHRNCGRPFRSQPH